MCLHVPVRCFKPFVGCGFGRGVTLLSLVALQPAVLLKYVVLLSTVALEPVVRLPVVVVVV